MLDHLRKTFYTMERNWIPLSDEGLNTLPLPILSKVTENQSTKESKPTTTENRTRAPVEHVLNF